ncbi:hypothetical protein FACS189415_7610 [Bacteroidia bacterium]|nr:hypothetical protein FACS189415_7610 [Bacteroidia bacterium]
MKEIMKEIGYSVEWKLKQLVGRPSPLKRLVVVTAVCAAFGIANLYVLYCAVYEAGENNALKEVPKGPFNPPGKREAAPSDSIQLFKQEKK